MILIDFNGSPAQAFRHGFLKGLAAPALLFNVDAVPAPIAVAPLTVPPRTDAEALAGDWQRVGDDLRRALARHGEAV